MAKEISTVDIVVNLCKRRGFVFPCGEIYGGTRSAWDYGPLGVELKENIKRQWWKSMVHGREDVVGLDSSIILPLQTWVASGHVGAFSDPLIECLQCHKRHRMDHLQEAYAERAAKKGQQVNPDEVPTTDLGCPDCGTRGRWTEPRAFNMMLKTYLGVVDDESGLHYLRPETAQGIFINYLNVQNAARMKPPFGIAQTGKSFRNEITPGNFIFRTREFEQMEMEFFVKPGTDEEWHQYWINERLNWYVDLGIARDNLRLYEHPKEKLSHYSKGTVDIEYRFRFAGSEWGELEGIANRTDFDLGTHSKHSGTDLVFFDQASGEKYTPYVIEPAAGGSCCAWTSASPRSRRPCCRSPGTPTCRRRPGNSPPSCARTGISSSTTPRRSAGAIAARTRSARLSASRSTSTPSRIRPSRSASATAWRRSASRSTRSRATSRRA